MTCVLDPAQDLCRLLRADDDTHLAPDTHDCRPTCRNLAYTDTDIPALRDRAHRLRAIVDDPLAPSPRKARELDELRRITALIGRHDREGRT